MAHERGAPLSVAIIARDEADRIDACLNGLGFADDVVVVVDERSRDNTLEIAKSHGCRAVSMPWRGYAGQKQSAVELAAHDWVLILDADERIPEQTGERIAALITSLPGDDAAACCGKISSTDAGSAAAAGGRTGWCDWSTKPAAASATTWCTSSGWHRDRSANWTR